MSTPVVQRIYRGGLRVAAAVFGPKNTRVIEARIRYRMRLDLKTPRTLAEKVSWLEFNTDQALPSMLSDKVAVRSYVEELGYGDLLIPICGGPWSDLRSMDFSGLPERFVMKAAHGSGMNYVHVGPLPVEEAALRRLASEWLARPYARAVLEPHYISIPRRVYCEKYIEMSTGVVDYKIHCLNGVPAFILVTSDRDRGLKMNLFDMAWNPIPGLKHDIQQAQFIPRPPHLERMSQIATVLSGELPFTRVDLYDTGDEVLFGELTYSPAGGLFPYFTDEMQSKYGSVLTI